MKLTKKNEQRIKQELLYWQLHDLEARERGNYTRTGLASWYGVAAVLGDHAYAQKIDENIICLAGDLHRQGIKYWEISGKDFTRLSDFVSVL